MRLNGADMTRLPRLSFSPPRQVDIEAIAEYVAKLAGVGVLLPDESLSEHLRHIAGLPQEEAETV